MFIRHLRVLFWPETRKKSIAAINDNYGIDDNYFHAKAFKLIIRFKFLWTLSETHLTVGNEKCMKHIYKVYVAEIYFVTDINPFQNKYLQLF